MNGAKKMMMIQQSRRNEGGRNEGNQSARNEYRNEGGYGRAEGRMENRMEGRSENRMEGRAENYGEAEMRRRRDSRGRYMEGENDMEMRSYNGDMPESRRRGRYDEAEESPEMRRSNMYALPRNERAQNLIGFMGGSEMHGGEHRKQEHRMGKTSGGQEFDHQTAEEWTGMMKNADGTKGAKWTMEQVKPYMAQTGFKGEEMEFFAIMNAMYSDYCDVMKRFGLDRPEVYAALAKAWLEDKDAVEDKALMYWECIVEHD